MSLREKTNRLEVVLTLLLIQLILLPAALGVTYASSGTRPEHILTYTTGRLTWDSATETDGQGAARLELFRRSYDNVNAADGQRVIAPGTAGETVVRLKNNTGRTVSYTAVLYEKKTNAALPVTSALTGGFCRHNVLRPSQRGGQGAGGARRQRHRGRQSAAGFFHPVVVAV